MLHSALLLPALVTILLAQSPKTTPPTDLFGPGMKPGVACYRIPAMAVLPDGWVIVAADERVHSCDDLRSNRDINIVVRKSKDFGKTWSPMETVLDFPAGRSASDPSFIYDRKTGDLFLFFNYMDLDAALGRYRFQFVKSKDGGVTWSTPSEITSGITSPDESDRFLFITSGNGIQTADGMLLHTLVNVGDGSARLFGSDDHGISWRSIGTPAWPADESRVAELSDGRWMLNARVNKAGVRFVHISDDRGVSWTTRKDLALPDPGCNAGLYSITNYKTANLLVFSNPASETQRRRLTLRVSSDGGMSWPVEQLLYDGDAAYSCLGASPDRRLFVLFERNRQPVISLLILPETDWSTPGERGRQ